jgi:hypothetical protein
VCVGAAAIAVGAHSAATSSACSSEMNVAIADGSFPSDKEASTPATFTLIPSGDTMIRPNRPKLVAVACIHPATSCGEWIAV